MFNFTSEVTKKGPKKKVPGSFVIKLPGTFFKEILKFELSKSDFLMLFFSDFFFFKNVFCE